MRLDSGLLFVLLTIYVHRTSKRSNLTIQFHGVFERVDQFAREGKQIRAAAVKELLEVSSPVQKMVPYTTIRSGRPNVGAERARTLFEGS